MSASETDTRDRLIAVERDLAHMAEQQVAMSKKVDEMHNLLMQAKGARWLVLAAAAAGSFIAAKTAVWIGIFPK